ncbi:alpha/beta fold hydrolase [Ktedonosporobacter rubrisoli]|uniref:Alpha/beta fold hydrolase n=1 Tax=Ktedonosporobacter rubrisoli TaxID=2509675 RepID=A0A4P6JKD9_KTERU|nr:alpha/beta fold hydrolase [Ktedonosporobacter rubrisoli]QBD75432.1 alpha/beta fold hydrolase [Ktedonosporobacter rubrisoli]
MPFVTVPDGTRLYYEVSGQGEPLLLVNGQGMDHTSWKELRTDFTERYQVIIVDHRGTGLSDKPAEPAYTTRGLAQDMIAVLDHLGIARAHVYGFSLGGRISQWLGINYSQRVGALVLGATSPGSAHGIARSAEVEALWSNPPGDPQEALQKIAALFFSPAWAAANRETVRASFGNMPIPEYARKLISQASEAHDAWESLPQITAPTLILHGSADMLNPTGNASLPAERILNAELSILEGARHGYLVEFRQEASNIVNAFLARHPLQ